MPKNLRDYVNDVINDNRIFSYEDVLAMDNEEGKYYQKALDYQYGKIGFPMNAELANSSDVVFVHEYTRQDGTVVRAHYRSKAGHGNPNKPVMQSPKEYKSTLEKEINDYMDRDVQERYGKPTGFAVPVSHNYEVANKIMQTKEYKEFEAVLNQLLQGSDQKQSDMYLEMVEKAQKLQKLPEFGKLEKGLGLSYSLATSRPVYNAQVKAIKNPNSISSKIAEGLFPNATKYYRIAATNGQSVLRGIDDDNILYTVKQIEDRKLKEHILMSMRGNNVNIHTLVVQPKLNAELTRVVKNTSTVKNALKNYSGKLIFPIDFQNENNDLYKTIGHAHLFNPHRNSDGNIIVTLVDYYDFDESFTGGFAGALVDNAYVQQERGDLTNYVLLIDLKYTPEEWQKIINN